MEKKWHLKSQYKETSYITAQVGASKGIIYLLYLSINSQTVPTIAL